MLDDYEEFFAEFKQVHDRFASDPDVYKEAFNEMGQKVLRIIRRYEDELCSKSENSGFGKFSTNLSDKFWEQVRGYFPHIDRIELQ